jgi:outer membrane usher protein
MTRRPLAAELFAAALLLIASTAPAAETAPALQPVLLDVTVNEQRIPEPQMLLRDRDGRVYASADLLREWKLKLPKAAQVTFEGETYYRLDSLGAVRATIDEAAQAVAIHAAPALFERQSQNILSSARARMDRPGSGGFLNYDLFAEHASGRTSVNGTFETGLYTPHGVAVSRFAGSLGGGGSNGVRRLESSFTMDRPMHLNSLRLGDSVSRGGPGASPLRFSGLQFATNFAVQPGFITAPLPTLEGSAAVPSVVDVYVNNVLQGSRDVAPGPFQISNVPVISGGGTVQLVVRDVLGRETVSTQNYYASSQMLRRGLHDYSYELGSLRRGFGTRSNGYGALIASGTHRYGLTNNLTAEGSAQLSASRQQAGVGFAGSLPRVAMASGWLAASRGSGALGWAGGFSLERRTSAFSIGARTEMSGRGYSAVGEGRETSAAARRSVQAFADLPLAGGSIGINFLRRDLRAGPDETLLGGYASIGLGGGRSLQLFAQRAAAGTKQTILGAHLALGLGRRRSASASFESTGGRLAGTLSFQQDMPFGSGTGYRASIRSGEASQIRLQLDHQTSDAALGLQLARSSGGAGVRIGASGALGMVGGGLFASRSLGSSFAAVRVPGHAGIRVYADNQLVGTTDSEGKLIVPAMRAYENNVIRVEEADLPLDVQLDKPERVVRPFARSGVELVFGSRHERGALLRVAMEDGSELPAGTLVEIEGREGSLLVASGGEIYVPDLQGTVRVRALRPGGACSFTVEVPAGDDLQPRIDGLKCREEPRFAAR